VTTAYESIGGAEACRQVSELFHARVAADVELRRLFPGDMAALEERLALFLAEHLGGPKDYSAKRGKTSLGCRHAHLSISTRDAEAWLGNMFAALDEAGIDAPAANKLREFLTVTAHALSDPFQGLYTMDLDRLRAMLTADGGLAAASHYGRSLLGDACLRWDAPRVELLLSFGAEVHAGGGMDHDALYQTARGGGEREADGRAVAELLIRHGADVNRASGPGRGTPLHMAARRGHAQVAEALLNAGANIDIRDSNGVTPLLRAVNCVRADVVQLLISRGANPMLADKQGVTPMAAARKPELVEALKRALPEAEA
jgi:hemoglobin